MCFFASILLLKNGSFGFWKWFIPYLALTAGLETYCFYIAKTSTQYVDNQWLYNCFFMIYIIFHLYIFSKIIRTIPGKKIVLVCLLILIGLYGYDLGTQGIYKYFYTTLTTFGAIAILLSICYYYSLFTQEELHNILAEPGFWFATGCLIFFTTSTGVVALHEQIVIQSKINKFPIRYVIINMLNVVMYGCWVKSFICLKKNQAYFQ